jgi:hypothetical protein
MKDWLHLIRLVGLFGVAVLLFVGARPFFIPETFGDIGHYRAAAIGDAQARPVHYAAGTECATCHSDIAALRVEQKSRHGAISCQSCHGPLAAHVAAEGANKPARPEIVPLCTRCHELNAGRPKFIPQVDSAEHAGGDSCASCHNPHAPGVS